MVLAELQLEVQIAEQSLSITCKIESSIDHDEKLLIKTELPCELFHPAQEDPIYVVFPGGDKVQCLTSGVSIFSNDPTCEVVLHPLRSPIRSNLGVSLRSISAAIYNFGDRGLFGVPGRRLLLQDDDWRFEIGCVGHAIDLPQGFQSAQLRATHFVTLKRGSHANFTAKEAEHHLEELGRFLSFCHGHQVGVGFAIGVDEGGLKVYEEFGIGRVSAYHDGDGWLDRHQTNELPSLYTNFLEKIRDPVWDRTFHIATYWTTRSDTSLAGPDGGIILIQAALERVAWDVITQTPSLALSHTKAEELGFRARLQRSLEFIGIPRNIPESLVELSAAATSEGWADGPEAFIKIRNELIHPRKRIHSPDAIPYYEGYVLGKWYLELILLGLLAYQGNYSNRTRLGRRWVGDTEPVPWM